MQNSCNTIKILSKTLDDFERPCRNLLHKILRITKLITKVWKKIDLHYQSLRIFFIFCCISYVL